MNTVIIEDEQNAAAELSCLIKELIPSAKVIAQLDSVDAAALWFNTHPSPDLVFMDIQLGDGIAFQLFEISRINCPVIFCTAFDNYLLDAFKKNGIGYIVKPTSKQQLKTALEKFETLKNHFSGSLLKQLSALHYGKYKTSYLVHFKTRMIPIPIEEISLFYLKNETTYLVTREAEYVISKTLDVIEQETDPRQFYRVNRQYLIAHKFVKHIEQLEGRKLEIRMQDSSHFITVSKDKGGAFRAWMDQR
jgi:DNA-binding LytR/AlgR family response regulator